jgi:ferredoxin-NADP reductase
MRPCVAARLLRAYSMLASPGDCDTLRRAIEVRSFSTGCIAVCRVSASALRIAP